MSSFLIKLIWLQYWLQKRVLSSCLDRDRLISAVTSVAASKCAPEAATSVEYCRARGDVFPEWRMLYPYSSKTRGNRGDVDFPRVSLDHAHLITVAKLEDSLPYEDAERQDWSIASPSYIVVDVERVVEYDSPPAATSVQYCLPWR